MEIEIPFGAFDSELMHQEINIPEGFEATIEGDKIILTRTESVDDEIRKELLRIVKENKGSIYISLAPRIKSFLISLLEKQGEQKPIINVPPREVILAIWDLGNEWKELTNGSISTEYGTQLDYIQKHWHESEYYLREKQGGKNDSDVKDYNSIDPHFAKPIDMVEPKFKVGVWLVHNERKNIIKVVNHTPLDYEVVDILGYHHTITDTAIEKNYHLWTINDARDGDVLVDKWGNIGIYQGDTNATTWHSCCYCGVNKMFYDEGRHEFPCYPATKEQRDTLIKAMADAGWEFDFEKKELKKIEDEEYNGEDYGIDGLWHAINILEKTLGKVSGYQTGDGFLSHQCAITSVKKLYKPKPDWGEEDERIYQSIIDDTVQENQLDSKQIDWLKSIKSRVQPKQEWSEDDEQYLLVCKNALSKYQVTDKWDSSIISQWLDNKLKSLKDRAFPQQQEWSEEEKGNVDIIVSRLEVDIEYWKSRSKRRIDEDKRVIDWLKSLRPQNTWKPSKEQIIALRWVLNNVPYNKHKEEISGLLDQIKEL